MLAAQSSPGLCLDLEEESLCRDGETHSQWREPQAPKARSEDDLLDPWHRQEAGGTGVTSLSSSTCLCPPSSPAHSGPN